MKYTVITFNKFFFKFGKHEVDGSQTFWSQDPFKLLKLNKDLQKLLLMWVKSVFVVVKIKMEMLKLFMN